MIVAWGCFLSVGRSAAVRRMGPSRLVVMMDSAVGEFANSSGVGREVFGSHDAGVVDQDIERREVSGDFCGEGLDGSGVFDVEREGLHAGVGGDGFVEQRTDVGRR